MKSSFEVWKTVTLGNGLTVDDFRATISVHRTENLEGPAEKLLKSRRFTIAVERTEIDLVLLLLSDLGFERSTWPDAIRDVARKRGLETCPIETIFQLRLQYPDQPVGEEIYVGTDEIIVPLWDTTVFSVRNHEKHGIGLYSAEGDSGSCFRIDTKWVFIQPRSQ